MPAVGQMVRVQDEKTGLWPSLGKVTEIHPDRLPYIVESGRREMLRSRTMLRMEKQSLGMYDGQGQESEIKGVSPPSSSPDIDLEPLPTVPLRRSDRLKDKNLNPVTCATPSPKKKSSTSIGSCNGLLGQSNKRST